MSRFVIFFVANQNKSWTRVEFLVIWYAMTLMWRHINAPMWPYVLISDSMEAVLYSDMDINTPNLVLLSKAWDLSSEYFLYNRCDMMSLVVTMEIDHQVRRDVGLIIRYDIVESHSGTVSVIQTILNRYPIAWL